MQKDPMALLEEWFYFALNSGLKHPTSACLSTVSALGEPEGRFVDIKQIGPSGVVFTTYLTSRKAQAMQAVPSAALTFWWDNLGRQVRLEGEARRTSREEDENLFQAAPREAQLTAWTSMQGEILSDREELRQRQASLRRDFAGRPIVCPDYWGGFRIIPRQIEFFELQPDRLHLRIVYRRKGGIWEESFLQP